MPELQLTQNSNSLVQGIIQSPEVWCPVGMAQTSFERKKS